MKDCQDYTMDMERSIFERLSLKERIGIRFHTAICKDCRQYFIDSKTIDQLLIKRFKDIRTYTFTEEEKDQLKDRISK